jgi:hypothetical protein
MTACLHSVIVTPMRAELAGKAQTALGLLQRAAARSC